ncbi:MAG: hypothetical protein GY719_40685 [bacterium]|nr:hypothetical protein [bacterium]
MAADRTTRSSRWLRIALAVVILACAAAGVTLLKSQRGSSRSVEGLADALLSEVAARAETTTLGYLEIGPRSLEVVRQLVRAAEVDGTDDAALERLFRSLLAAHDEIEMLNLGRPNGDFMMVKRMPDSSLSTKWVRRAGDRAESSWGHDNEAWSRDLPYADKQEDAAEAYDPRARPWYRQAIASGGLSWVEPYVYYSDRMPGVACALPLHDDAGGLLGVVGADIGIAELSRLLAEFQLGRSGQAVILTADGRLIAYPAFSETGFEIAQEVTGSDGSELVLRRVEDSGDEALAGAFARRPDDGGETEPFTFEHGGITYVARFETFALGGDRSWTVGVLAPREELTGSMPDDHALTRSLTLAGFLLAIGLTVILLLRTAALEGDLREQAAVAGEEPGEPAA